jgi:TolB-like protein/Flp pilus assembly protein TadD
MAPTHLGSVRALRIATQRPYIGAYSSISRPKLARLDNVARERFTWFPMSFYLSYRGLLRYCLTQYYRFNEQSRSCLRWPYLSPFARAANSLHAREFRFMVGPLLSRVVHKPEKGPENLAMSGATTNRDSGTGGAKPRLDSWKEIATYVKRGVRTVRRWERQEGLPVHRHRHSKQATVYAFGHEIDSWLERRSAAEDADQFPVDRAPQPSAGPGRETREKDRGIRPTIIAILPLRNLGGDSKQERFADGLTEELISEIGQCCPKSLRVIALTSVMQYKQSPKSIGQIGKELGADYILEGGIRLYGRRVRLTARLISARDQAHIWADRYEIHLPPIFSQQQALARQLADSVSAELRMTPRRGRDQTISNTTGAHNAYLEATSHFLPTKGDITKSIEHLHLAIERDPEFAPSYAELALSYLRRLTWDYPPVVTFKRIEEYASKSLKLDPKLARAHSMMAAFQLFRALAWSKAERSTRRAIKLNPSDAWARIVRAAYHLVVGELQEAVEELARVRQLDPQSLETGQWFASFAYFARRYDLASEHCQGIIRLDPSNAYLHMILGLSLVQKGEYALALSHCEKARELGDSSISQISRACSIYALAGERDTAERLFQELVAAKERQYTRYIFLAHASACLGKEQQTLELLDKAYEQHDPLLVFLRTDPRFEQLSGLPSFRNLLRRIGLPRHPVA